MARITLLTDFGTRDGYVGAMKGVMVSLFPGVTLDDIAHDVTPGDVPAAAIALERYWDRYPGGTVHLCVVDPGVGTERRAIALEADRRFIVAPDNGLVSRVLESARRWRAVEISDSDFLPQERSTTFHGRDIFAPVAAYLARGIHVSRLGPRVDDPVHLVLPEAADSEGDLVGEVVQTDRFGNLITNLPGKSVVSGAMVQVAGRSVPVRETYGQVEPKEAVALVNSDGRLEVAARDGSAAELLGAGVGTPVRLLRGIGTEGGTATA